MPRRLLFYLLPLLVSTACSVYTPLHTPVPVIDGPQQVEVSGSVSTLGYLQGGVAYSPVRHVLLQAAYGSGRTESEDDGAGSTTPWRAQQWEAALGTYWRPSPAVLLGGLAGYSKGAGTHDYTRRSGVRGSLLQPRPDSVWTYQYSAAYQRLFADAYVHLFTREDALLSMGFVYRVSYVRFSRYTNAGVPTELRQLWRHEPVAFARLGTNKGNGLESLIQGQIALSYAFSPGFAMPRERAGNRDATEVRKPLPAVTFSLILRPQVLWQRRR